MCFMVEMDACTHPNEYLACICCLNPVFIPPIPMKAGGMHVSMEKKRITNAASRRFIPKTKVASMPVGMLGRSQRGGTKECLLVKNLREEAHQSGEEHCEEVEVLSVGPLLHRHRPDTILLNTNIKKPLVPLGVLLWMRLIDFAVLHPQ